MPRVSPRLLPAIAALGLCLGVLASSGCSTLHAALPDDFAARATAYPVSGHSPRRFNEPVRFGPYSALEMREGDTFSWTLPFAVADFKRTTKPVAFTLVARGEAPVEVQCATRASWVGIGSASRRVELDVGAVDGPMLDCGLRMDGEQPQRLQLGRMGQRMSGSLLAPWGARYAVESVHGYAGSRWSSGTPTAYRIGLGKDTVAVVDVVNAGRVHLADGLDAGQRVYLAAAAAALLLLDPELGE